MQHKTTGALYSRPEGRGFTAQKDKENNNDTTNGTDNRDGRNKKR
jgi:hypothetical protein